MKTLYFAVVVEDDRDAHHLGPPLCASALTDAVGYYRVACHDREHSQLDGQLLKVQCFARGNRLRITQGFYDYGASRENLAKALDHMASMNIKTLVVEDFERLARDPLEFTMVFRAMKTAGLTILDCHGQNLGREVERRTRPPYGYAMVRRRR